MSLTPVPTASAKITSNTLLERKQARQPITALTAYDYATARPRHESAQVSLSDRYPGPVNQRFCRRYARPKSSDIAKTILEPWVGGS